MSSGRAPGAGQEVLTVNPIVEAIRMGLYLPEIDVDPSRKVRWRRWKAADVAAEDDEGWTISALYSDLLRAPLSLRACGLRS